MTVPFDYIEAHSIQKAVALLGEPGTVAMGGGTDLLPQVRDGVVAAGRLVGLAAIPELAAIEETADGGLSIGAAATIADVASHPLVRRHAALAEAAGGLATPQIRNEGTIGGNLAQRPRCWYYRSPLIPCLKKGGDRCYALAGNTRLLCVTGGRPVLYRASIRHRGGPQRVGCENRNHWSQRKAGSGYQRVLRGAGQRPASGECAGAG